MFKRFLSFFKKRPENIVRRIDQIQSEFYIPPHFHIERHTNNKKEK